MNPLPPASGNGRGFDERTRDVCGPRLLIADKHRLFAEALGHALTEAGLVVDVATSPSDALGAARSLRPDLVILGAGFTAGSGVEVRRAIASELPECRVIVLVDEGEAPTSSEIGVDHGLVSRATTAPRFVTAIEDFLRGYVLPPLRRGSLVSGAAADGPWIVPLTGREREALRLLVAGATSDEIAARFGVRPNTARKHVQNLLTKLQVHSRVEAVTVAIRRGVVKVTDVDGSDGHPSRHLSEADHLTSMP